MSISIINIHLKKYKNSSISQIAEHTTLDREKQSVLRFHVFATDMPEGGVEQKSSRALVTLDVLDVNDNAPTFPQDSYTAVIPENAHVDVSVINITATDPDEGKGGAVHFEIIDEGETNGKNKLFFILHADRINKMFEKIYRFVQNRPQVR